MKPGNILQITLALGLAALMSFLFLRSQLDHSALTRAESNLQQLRLDELRLRRFVELAAYGGVQNYDALERLARRLQTGISGLADGLSGMGLGELTGQARNLEQLFERRDPALMDFERSLALQRVSDLYLPSLGDRLRGTLRRQGGEGPLALFDRVSALERQIARLGPLPDAQSQKAARLIARLADLSLAPVTLGDQLQVLKNDFVRLASTRIKATVLARKQLAVLRDPRLQRGLESLHSDFLQQVSALQAKALGYRMALFALAMVLLLYLAWVFFSLQDATASLRSAIRDLNFHKFVADEHAIVSATDAQGRITYTNDHFRRLTGYAEPDLIGQNHRILKSDVHDPAFYENLWNTITSGQVWQGTICNRARDGSLHWLETTIVPRLDASGEPYEYLAIRTDVSDKVSAERQVAWLARIPEENPEPVMRLDRKGRVLYANEAAAGLLRELQDANQQWLQQHWPTGVIRALETRHSQEMELLVAGRYYHFYLVPVPAEEYVNIYAHDVTERRKAELQLSHQARHDALTGLANRHAFEAILDDAIELARFEGQPSMLLYLDLDQFKVVNDTCGHVAGDELLRQLGARLARQIRGNDEIARLGGDEFAVLLRNCPLEAGMEIAEKLRSQVSEFQFAWEGKSFRVGVSIGVVEIREDATSRDEVMAAADVACYAAKDAGRNRIHLFHLDDNQAAQRRDEMHWAARIPQALVDDRFVLVVQAVVPLQDKGARGHYEVLIRMRDEAGQLIPPGAFIPAAERYDLMPAIDHWVVQRVFEALARLKDSGQDMARWRFAVNLCGPSLGDVYLVEFIAERLRELELPPGQLSFEVTETAAVGNLSDAVEFIQRLKSLGCEIALDDFGSGLSSFAYLKNLPVDFLKIDGAFVKDLLDDPIDAAMVEAINQIGHVMKIRTIAEFVENDETFERLRQIGVDFAQGYAIDRPRALEELVQAAQAMPADGTAGGI